MRTVWVRVAVAERVKALQSSADACLRRMASAPVGEDHVELARYEQIHSELDSIAYAEARRSSDDPAAPSDEALDVLWPFAPGPAYEADNGRAAPQPSRQPWRSKRTSPGRTKPERREVVQERFAEQLARWLDHSESSTELEPVCPSGILDQALPEALRKFADIRSGDRPAAAPVVYQDGSAARPLQLASLELSRYPSIGDRRILRVTLLSIRHLDMDATVDGAWLRNREVSVGRQAGVTDELVYSESRSQLARLTQNEPLQLYMFQTGLPPAVVGFYRAVIDHHLEGSGYNVDVFPRYYEGTASDGKSKFTDGTPWCVVS